jgi:hypothetical protein
MSPVYAVILTAPQIRTLQETLAVVLNDPDLIERIGPRDYAVLDRAASAITRAGREARS